jgi:methylated-DNA-protein-cysteine methyltransferase-like protein
MRRERILATVDSIPKGRVSTYGRIAEEVGLLRGARQVGKALRELPPGRDVPWHRVINAAGKISHADPAAATRQRRRLEAEGVEFSKTGRVDLERFGWPRSAV